MSSDGVEDELIPVFMPALVVLLTRAEQTKAATLTEEEVLAIRDQGRCVMLPPSVASHIAAKRGYDDLNPEFAWEQWQQVRGQLTGGSESG